jgi:hypothetical protein
MRYVLPVWPLIAVVIGLYGFQNAWGAALGYHAGTILALWQMPSGLGKLRSGFTWGWAAASLGLMLGTFVSVRLALPRVIGIDPGMFWDEMPSRLASLGLAGPSLVLFGVYFVTLHPVLEDLAWHGVLSVKPIVGPFHPHDFWFAIYHVPVLLKIFPGAWVLAGISFIVLVLSSATWRIVAKRTGGLQAMVLQHAAADAAILGAVLWRAAG